MIFESSNRTDGNLIRKVPVTFEKVSGTFWGELSDINLEETCED